MSYTPPSGDAIVAQFGSGYTSPAGDAIVAQFGGAGVPSGTMAATLALAGEIDATHELPVFAGTLAAGLDLAGGMDVAHGIVGSAWAVLELGVDVQARHGVVGAASAALGITGAAVATFPRFQLRGVVQDGGSPVERRVRAYKRSTGALVAQGDTTGGAFVLDVGYALDEFVILPIDLANDATDWTPPCANRVLSVLLVD